MTEGGVHGLPAAGLSVKDMAKIALTLELRCQPPDKRAGSMKASFPQHLAPCP